MTKLPLLVLLITVFCVHAQVCHKDMSKNVQHGMRLHPPTLLDTITPMGLKQCAKECLKRTSCKSFNYDRSQLTCELNKTNATCSNNYLLSTSGYDYHDIGLWSKDLAGACVDHKCPENTKCIGLHDGKTTCVVSECSDPPSINSTSVPVGELAVGKKVVYSCSDGKHSINLTCRAGKWINNDNITCPSNGSKQDCQKSYVDCFTIVPNPKQIFPDAERYCRTQYNSILVLIDSLETQLLHISRLNALNITGNFWMNVKKDVHDKWVTASSSVPLLWINWDSGQPADGAFCATMDAGTGTWSSSKCSTSNPFICQKL